MENIVASKLWAHFAKYKPDYKKKGDTLIGIGEEPDAVYYLKSGYVKMSTILENGNELILNIYKPGSLFPMFWALGKVANNYAFTAMADSQIRRAPKKEVIEYLEENPDVVFDLIKRILAGVDGLLTNYNHLLTGNADSRVASAILIAAKRFGKERKDDVLIDLKLTHQDIADLAGISRETASISIEKLLKEGTVKQVKKQFAISDMDRLTKKTDIYEEDELSDPSIL